MNETLKAFSEHGSRRKLGTKFYIEMQGNGEISIEIHTEMREIYSGISHKIYLLESKSRKEPGKRIIAIIQGERKRRKLEEVVDITKLHNRLVFCIYQWFV